MDMKSSILLYGSATRYSSSSGCEHSEAANGWAWPLGNLKQLIVDRLQPSQTAINSSRTCIEYRRIKVYLTRGGHNAIKSTGSSSSQSPTLRQICSLQSALNGKGLKKHAAKYVAGMP